MSSSSHASRSIGRSVLTPASAVPATWRALRPDYPYSVIPGGAYSPAELRYASEKDHLVRIHYADFNLRNARLVRLTDERFQYVSFRLHERIYWTRNQLRIPKGEILLTDGHYYARTRCGNRLSSLPQPNTTALQPSAHLLSLPPFQPELLRTHEIQLAAAPPTGELAQEFPVLPFEMPRLAPYVPAPSQPASAALMEWPIVENYLPTVATGGEYLSAPGAIALSTLGAPGFPGPLSFTARPLISEAPEPASLYLFGVTFFVSLWFLTRMMRDNDRSEEDLREDER